MKEGHRIFLGVILIPYLMVAKVISRTLTHDKMTFGVITLEVS
jgi:hypothetical protein